jgi:hypothetical protein
MIEPKLVTLLAVGTLLLMNGILDITRRRYAPALQTSPVQGSSSNEAGTDEGL